MNNLYHRFASASVGIALAFALGANKEARAATFIFTSTSSYSSIDDNLDGVVDFRNSYPGERPIGLKLSEDYTEELWESSSSYQFDIANLSLDSTTRIKSAIFRTTIDSIERVGYQATWGAYGYKESSLLFNHGEPLAGASVKYSVEDGVTNFGVTQFIVNQRIENNDYFWLSLRASRQSFFTLPYQTSLIITTEPITTEPVPEPTTIFGSVIGLCLGGWLKRRKSSPQHKTTPQD